MGLWGHRWTSTPSHQTNKNEKQKWEKQRRENDTRTTRSERNGHDADWQGDGGWTLWLTAAHADPTGVPTRVPAPRYDSTQIRSKIQGKKAVFQCPSLKQGTILPPPPCHVASVMFCAHEVSTSSGAAKYCWRGVFVVMRTVSLTTADTNNSNRHLR